MTSSPVVGMRPQRFRVHPETTYGTAEAVVEKKLNSLRVAVTPAKTVEAYAPEGDALPSIGVVTDDSTTLAFTGKLSFSDVVYPLASLFGPVTPTLLGGIAYQWVFPWDGTAVVNAQSYTMSYGDATLARLIAGVLFNTLSFGVARDGNLQMTSNGFGKKLVTGYVSYPRGTVYTLTITATGGTYTVTWDTHTTANIAQAANAAAIQAAIIAAGGNVTVTGIGPYTITNVSTATDITASVAVGSLTGGTATLVKAQTGGPETSIVAVPVFPLMFDVYMDTTWAGLGTTKIGSIYSMDFAFAERWARTRPIDSTQQSDGYAETAGDTAGQNHTANFVFAADAIGEAKLAEVDAGSQRFFRIEANGAANSIDAGHAYLFRMDFCHHITGFGAYGAAQGGVHSLPVNGRFFKDQTTGNGIVITVNNKLAAL